MKTILDLIGEFAALNDRKVREGGVLPEEQELRFRELKGFYDVVMTNTGVAPRRVTRRFSAEDVLARVTARERLRVPIETEMIFETSGEVHAGLVVNLSRGGVFLAARQLLPVSTRFVMFLTSPDAADHPLIEAPAQVVWATEWGVSEALLPPGMGISFVEKKGILERYLDAMVVDALVRHLSGVDATSLAPDFVGKELVEL